MAADQAKDRGNQAFAAGRYADAVASFSEAIALQLKSGGGNGDLHVYHSNRSAAYLKTGDGAKALADAEHCLSLKRSWAKGYSRKGAALYHLARYADAFRAYKEGLALDAGNAALLDGLRSVELKMAAPPGGTSSRPSASYGASPPPRATARPSASSPPAKTLKSLVARDKAAMFQSFQFLLRSVMLTLFVSYWLPVLVPAYVAYATFFKLALFNYASYLLFTHGRPQWQAAYAQRLVLDPTIQAFFFSLIFWVSAPYSLALVPIALIETVHWFAYLNNLLQVLGLADNALVVLVTTKALHPVVATVISDPTWPSLPSQSKWAKLYHRIPQVAANIEVGIGIALVVELLTPARNFLLVVLYWQLLRVRYMISPQLQESFRLFNASILGLVHHPRCPAIVRTGYSKIQAMAVKMTDVAQQQQAAGSGLASKCCVM